MRACRSLLLLSFAALLAISGCNKENPPPRSAKKEADKTLANKTAAKTASAHKTAEPSELKLEIAYRGRIWLPVKAPGAKPSPHAGVVIRDQAAYDALIKRIPKKRVTKKRPAPPSSDPLLKQPVIDFEKKMLVVVTRDDMYVGPAIKRIRKGAGGVIVEVALPDAGNSKMMARVIGVGTYHAVVVPKAGGKAVFQFK
jgi:hypothetical protein